MGTILFDKNFLWVFVGAFMSSCFPYSSQFSGKVHPVAEKVQLSSLPGIRCNASHATYLLSFLSHICHSALEVLPLGQF